MKSLINVQTLHLKKVLEVSQRSSESSQGDDYVWSILIFDQFSQEMFSTLYKIGQLRDKNITLHLKITANREKIHCLNALYVCQPTEENINIISDDLAKGLYNSVFINFTFPISRQLLDTLAKRVALSRSAVVIKDIMNVFRQIETQWLRLH